eukprot:PhM_4_TR14127/c1_g1_i10/m.90890
MSEPVVKFSFVKYPFFFITCPNKLLYFSVVVFSDTTNGVLTKLHKLINFNTSNTIPDFESKKKLIIIFLTQLHQMRKERINISEKNFVLSENDNKPSVSDSDG